MHRQCSRSHRVATSGEMHDYLQQQRPVGLAQAGAEAFMNLATFYSDVQQDWQRRVHRPILEDGMIA